MEELRSKSFNNDGRLQIEGGFNNYNNGSYGSKTNIPNSSGLQDFRSYSTSYASSNKDKDKDKDVNLEMGMEKEAKFKKGKSTNGSSLSKSWSLSDPELKRKKRVASYKVYSVEGKVKGSLKNSFRWLKERCTKVVYGWR